MSDQLSALVSRNYVAFAVSWEDTTIIEEAEDSDKIETKISLPIYCSSYVTTVLYALCDELYRLVFIFILLYTFTILPFYIEHYFTHNIILQRTLFYKNHYFTQNTILHIDSTTLNRVGAHGIEDSDIKGLVADVHSSIVQVYNEWIQSTPDFNQNMALQCWLDFRYIVSITDVSSNPTRNQKVSCFFEYIKSLKVSFILKLLNISHVNFFIVNFGFNI